MNELDLDAEMRNRPEMIYGHMITQAVALTLFTFHTYCMAAAEFTPHIILTSPMKRSGKSTVMRIMGELVSKALKVEHCTTAAVFRAIDRYRPTLLIDEADSFVVENEQIRGLLNSSFERGGGVLRCEGEANEPTRFDTFASTVLAAIDALQATIMDRGIIINLKRKSSSEMIEKFRRPAREACIPLRQKLRRWADDNVDRLADINTDFPSGLNDREEDAWEPLLQIARVLSDEWHTAALKTAQMLSGEEANDESDLGQSLLSDIEGILKQNNAERVTSAWLCDELVQLEGQPWANYSNKGEFTQQDLAKLLKPFKIIPRQGRVSANTLKLGSQTKANYKGYRVSWFSDACERYRVSETSTPSTLATAPIDTAPKGSTGTLIQALPPSTPQTAVDALPSTPEVSPTPAKPDRARVVDSVSDVDPLSDTVEVAHPVSGKMIVVNVIDDPSEARVRVAQTAMETAESAIAFMSYYVELPAR